MRSEFKSFRVNWIEKMFDYDYDGVCELWVLCPSLFGNMILFILFSLYGVLWSLDQFTFLVNWVYIFLAMQS